jgi:hypothetical protein
MNQEVKVLTGVSLSDLDATKASDKAFEFEYINKAGNATGIFFKVLGGESETVKAETARLQNERRRQHAAREVRSKIGVGAKKIEFDSFESDVEYGRRLAAVRLVGWRTPTQTDGLTAEQIKRFSGINDPFTVENALRLCQSNDHIAESITVQSDTMENFIGI